MSAMDVFWAAPPISRTLAASAFGLSILVYTGMLSGYYVFFDLSHFLKLPPQLWRLVTPFLLTGPQLGILFDTYFLYTYGSKLETASPKFSQPGDFFSYLVFVCVTIICNAPNYSVPGDEEDYPYTSPGPSFAINPKGQSAVWAWWEVPLRKLVRFFNFTRVVGLNVALTGGMIFSSALILALAYTASQDERGQKATFIVITIPAQWIPYAMLLMTMIMAGPGAAKIQATGLVAAHLHDFLTRLWPTFGGGRNLLPTPAFVKRMWQTTEATTAHRAYGTSFTPAQREPASGSGGVLPESWRSRGSGHRLGGE